MKPLKETSGAEDPITAAIEHLDLIVQSLDEATALAVQEVIRDLVEALVQGREKAVKPGQPALFDETRPAFEVVTGFRLGERLLKEEGEDLAQPMGRFQARGVCKQPLELLALLGIEIGPRLSALHFSCFLPAQCAMPI